MRTRLAPMLLILLGPSGCVAYSYRPYPLAPEAWTAPPRWIRATAADRTRALIYRPRLDGDTLRGTQDRGEVRSPRRWQRARGDLLAVEVRRVNWTGLVVRSGILLGVTAAAVALVVKFAGSDWGGIGDLGSGDWGGFP